MLPETKTTLQINYTSTKKKKKAYVNDFLPQDSCH